MWADALEIAIVEQDMEKVSYLLDNMPKLEDVQEAKRALYLLKEAFTLANNFKNETMASMQQIKKNIAFLNSTQSNTTAKFDITS